jgi:hypothetical protein
MEFDAIKNLAPFIHVNQEALQVKHHWDMIKIVILHDFPQSDFSSFQFFYNPLSRL